MKNYKDGGSVSSSTTIPINNYKDGGIVYANQGTLTGKTIGGRPVTRGQKTELSWDDIKGSVRSAADLIPIVGDALAAKDVYDELNKTPINWEQVGLLSGVALLGVLPIPASAAKKVLEGAKKKKKKTGGRMAKPKEIYIQHPDGTVEVKSGLKEDFGLTANQWKKNKGIMPDGTKWNTTGEFKDIKERSKQGQAAREKQDLIDPNRLDFESIKGQRAQVKWSNIPNAKDVQEEVDFIIEDHLDEFLKDKPMIGGDHYVRGAWSEMGQHSGRYNLVGGDGRDINKGPTFVAAKQIADSAWPDIVRYIDGLNLPNADRNELLKWSRKKS